MLLDGHQTSTNDFKVSNHRCMKNNICESSATYFGQHISSSLYHQGVLIIRRQRSCVSVDCGHNRQLLINSFNYYNDNSTTRRSSLFSFSNSTISIAPEQNAIKVQFIIYRRDVLDSRSRLYNFYLYVEFLLLTSESARSYTFDSYYFKYERQKISN